MTDEITYCSKTDIENQSDADADDLLLAKQLRKSAAQYQKQAGLQKNYSLAGIGEK
jgi:hypothetical protein